MNLRFSVAYKQYLMCDCVVMQLIPNTVYAGVPLAKPSEAKHLWKYKFYRLLST
jgi:hypothetical protein